MGNAWVASGVVATLIPLYLWYKGGSLTALTSSTPYPPALHYTAPPSQRMRGNPSTPSASSTASSLLLPGGAVMQMALTRTGWVRDVLDG